MGSVSTPVLQSLLRFLPLNSTTPEALPAFLSTTVDDVWDYHKYITYTTGGEYDHIYAYSSKLPVDAHEKGGDHQPTPPKSSFGSTTTPSVNVDRYLQQRSTKSTDNMVVSATNHDNNNNDNNNNTNSMFVHGQSDVYASISIEEYSFRAQLVQLQQYRALFDG